MFAARTAGRQDLNPAERTLITAAQARAASEILHEQRDQLGQALCTIQTRDGHQQRSPLEGSEPPAIGVVDRHIGWTIPSPGGRDVTKIAVELGAARATGNFRRIGAGGLTQLPVPLTVVTDRRALQLARHGHRTLGLDGPWGCIAKSSRSALAPPLEIVAGSSAVLDEGELGRLAAMIFARADQHLAELPEGTFQWLGREMTRTYVDAWRVPEWGFERPAEVRQREEFLISSLQPAPRDSLHLAWATGVALHRLLLSRSPRWSEVSDRGAGRSLSPSVLVPSDQGDFAALTAVQFTNGQPEALDDFAVRLREQQRREQEGRGPVSDSLRKAVGQHTQPRLRAKLFQAMLSGLGPLPGPLDWIQGTGRVQLVDWDEKPAVWPLHSAASPPRTGALTPWRGGVTVTVHRFGGEASLCVHAGGDFGRRSWHEELSQELKAALS